MQFIDILIVVFSVAIVTGTFYYHIRKKKKDKRDGCSAGHCSGCSMEDACASYNKT